MSGTSLHKAARLKHFCLRWDFLFVQKHCGYMLKIQYKKCVHVCNIVHFKFKHILFSDWQTFHLSSQEKASHVAERRDKGGAVVSALKGTVC